jgi:aminoglycoside phosphotransferase (APT) family kinase protein
MRAALEAWLRSAWRADRVEVSQPARLAGGAIQDNHRLAVRVTGGPMAGTHDLVLRRDAPSTLPMSHDRTREYRLLEAARAAGVTVAEPVALCPDPAILGSAFFLMRHVAGSADPRRLTAEAPLPGLVNACGRNLARIHAIPADDLTFLGPAPADPARAAIALLRTLLDTLPDRHPGLEYGLAALDRTAPPPVPATLCHRDFRTGNIMAEAGHLTAVLDWEFADWSDPAEDIGWFCAACWRFRRPDLEAGGLGSRADLLSGYREAGGTCPEPARIDWWQTIALARWAVIALHQVERQRSGGEDSLELALTGHLVPELELELLTATGPA